MKMILEKSIWKNYELIDTGEREKLEKFGDYIIRRPEPQAVWDKTLSYSEWEKLADATFLRKNNSSREKEDAGEWNLKKGTPERWVIEYDGLPRSIMFRLGLTSFKHVGLFPEQSENWKYIYNSVKSLKINNPKVLNLFAYTGGASLAACAAGAQVTHVDSVRHVISWAKENMELSGLSNISWVVEDALKFVSRESKRGNKYSGIIIDPPAYGRGPDGEKWILEDDINKLIKLCGNLLDNNGFILLNLYSIGFSSLIAKNLIKMVSDKQIEFGELFIEDNNNKILPLGVFSRTINL